MDIVYCSDIGARFERDAFDTLFDHAPEKLTVVKKVSIEAVFYRLSFYICGGILWHLAWLFYTPKSGSCMENTKPQYFISALKPNGTAIEL